MADISVTAANVIKGSNPVVKTVQAGVAVTAGQVVYQDTSDKKYKLADADAQATAVAAGIALNDAAANQPMEIQTEGNIDVGGTLVKAEILIVSVTAGNLSRSTATDSITGKYMTSLGICTATNVLAINIQVGGIAVP